MDYEHGSTPSAPTYGNVAAFFVSAPLYPSHSKNHSIHILSVFLSFGLSISNAPNCLIVHTYGGSPGNPVSNNIKVSPTKNVHITHMSGICNSERQRRI